MSTIKHSVKKAAPNRNINLLKTAAYSDVTIECDGFNFKAHRCILCPRSSTLAAAIDRVSEASVFS